jgi:hypothetical protein
MSRASAHSKRKYVAKKKAAPARRVNVDIVTGKEAVSIYFDPAKSSDCEISDSDWLGENLFAPALILKDDGDTLSVRLPTGEVYKVLSDAVRVAEQDDEGVDDILKLRDFSEMSLIHTLRVRYARDEIYTFGTDITNRKPTLLMYRQHNYIFISK